MAPKFHSNLQSNCSRSLFLPLCRPVCKIIFWLKKRFNAAPTGTVVLSLAQIIGQEGLGNVEQMKFKLSGKKRGNCTLCSNRYIIHGHKEVFLFPDLRYERYRQLLLYSYTRTEHESITTARSNTELLLLHRVPFSYNFTGILSAYSSRISM